MRLNEVIRMGSSSDRIIVLTGGGSTDSPVPVLGGRPPEDAAARCWLPAGGGVSGTPTPPAP